MHHSAAANRIEFSILRIEAWAPGVSTPGEWQEWASGAREIGIIGEPALQQMQPLLRRHAGRLGRFACSVAYEALDDLRDVPIVFSSRYGEVSRSVDLLSSLALGEELSPATFGLSVHNAIPGLLSMARKDTANTISLAAGDDSAEFGLIEACGLLDDGAECVLLIVADVPLPAIYEAFADTSAEPFGWAALIMKPNGASVRLEWSESPADDRYSDSRHSDNRHSDNRHSDSRHSDNRHSDNRHSAASNSLASASASTADSRKPLQGALAALAVLVGNTKSAERVSGHRTWHWTQHG